MKVGCIWLKGATYKHVGKNWNGKYESSCITTENILGSKWMHTNEDKTIHYLHIHQT